MFLAKRVVSFAGFAPSPQGVASKRRGPWLEGEPSLQDVLADPIVHLVMKRDGLRLADVTPIIEAAKNRLGRGLCDVRTRRLAA